MERADLFRDVRIPAPVRVGASRIPARPAEAVKEHPLGRFLAGGVDAGLVGSDRVLMALAARKEASEALGLPEPRLRFFHRDSDASAAVPLIAGAVPLGQFRYSVVDSGLVLVQTRMTLRMTADTVAHECVHSFQAVLHGDVSKAPRALYERLERQAELAGQDFAQFLQRNFWVFDDRFSDVAAVRWANQVLYGRPRASWTPPGSLTA